MVQAVTGPMPTCCCKRCTSTSLAVRRSKRFSTWRIRVAKHANSCQCWFATQRPSLGGTAALLPEQGPHAQLGGPSLFGQLKAVTNNVTQPRDVLGRQPYPRQITD